MLVRVFFLFNILFLSSAQADKQNGQYIFHAAGCASCHKSAGSDQEPILGGGHPLKTPIGTFSVPNISRDPQNGIGKWTKEEFADAVRKGISPHSSPYLPAFPYLSYGGMTDQDVYDLWDFIIQDLPASGKVNGTHVLKRLLDSFALRKVWHTFFANKVSVFKKNPNLSPQYERGRYLVEHVAHCGECHTPRKKIAGFNLGTLDKSQAFAGTKLGELKVPGLTSEKLKRYGSDRFVKHMRAGQTFSESDFRSEEMKHVATNIKQLCLLDEAKCENDLKAIYAYLAGEKQRRPDRVNPPVAKSQQSSPILARTVGRRVSREEAAARKVLDTHCARCHSGANRTGLENILDMAALANKNKTINKTDPEKSKFYRFMSGTAPTMPKDCFPPEATCKSPPSNEEQQVVLTWISSLLPKAAPVGPIGQRTPEDNRPNRQNQFVSFQKLYREAAADLRNELPNRQSGYRYFSLVSLYNNVTHDKKQLKKYVHATFKLLNSLSQNPEVVVVKTVNNNGYLIRFHLDDVNWDSHKWDQLVASYPYGLNSAYDENLQDLQGKLHTKIPVLRADWFIANASKSPLYYDLLGLPDTFQQLTKELRVKVKRNIETGKAKRAGIRANDSGVSDHNRLIERHPMERNGVFWTSYDFASSGGLKDIFNNPFGPGGPHGFVPDGGESIFSLPNGFHGYYLNKADGTRLNEGPRNIVTDRKYGGDESKVLNGISCFGCHIEGIIEKKDSLRSQALGHRFGQDILQRIKELHPEEAKLQALFRQDIKAYKDALGRAKIDLDKITGKEIEMIRTFYIVHKDEKVDLEKASTELGFPADEFDKRLLAVRGVSRNFRDLASSITSDYIDRLTWEESFADAMALNPDYTVIRPSKRRSERSTEHILTVIPNRRKYRVGDPFYLTFKSNVRCRLTLVNTDSGGNACINLPSRDGQQTILRPGQSVTYPPASTGFRLQSSGTESFTALCAPLSSQNNANGDNKGGVCSKLPEKGAANFKNKQRAHYRFIGRVNQLANPSNSKIARRDLKVRVSQ